MLEPMRVPFRDTRDSFYLEGKRHRSRRSGSHRAAGGGSGAAAASAADAGSYDGSGAASSGCDGRPCYT